MHIFLQVPKLLNRNSTSLLLSNTSYGGCILRHEPDLFSFSTKYPVSASSECRNKPSTFLTTGLSWAASLGGEVTVYLFAVMYYSYFKAQIATEDLRTPTLVHHSLIQCFKTPFGLYALHTYIIGYIYLCVCMYLLMYMYMCIRLETSWG